MIPSAYTAAQIERWEGHVGLPERFRAGGRPAHTLEYLTALHVHQLAAVPYENLVLHYSPAHAVSLDPARLFDKIVVAGRGRGGYCMENSLLFHHVLRGLGFEVYVAGARNRFRTYGIPKGDYSGWVHCVNIVTLEDGSKYMLDVAFGGDGPTRPLPMVEGVVTDNLGTQQVRLMYEALPEQINKKHKYWIYQYRNSTDVDWNAFYCFPELEFLHADFEVMSYFTSTSQVPQNFQTKIIIITRFLKKEDEDVIAGKIMLVDGVVKLNNGGKTAIIQTCLTEEERIEALKKHFNITLTPEEIGAIKGRVTELVQT